MDTLRSIVVVSVTELAMMGTLAPLLSESMEEQADRRRVQGRHHVHVTSVSRGDYPVIFNWLQTPETGEASGEA